MNCVHCSEPLKLWELPQPIRTALGEITPSGACDECCRAFQWQPGPKEALERLVRGEVDSEESARVAEIVSQW